MAFRELLLAGGLLVTHADGHPIRRDQAQILIHALLRLCADPEERIGSVHSPEEAQQMLDGAAKWLAENAGQERYAAFLQVAHIATVDGTCPPRPRRRRRCSGSTRTTCAPVGNRSRQPGGLVLLSGTASLPSSARQPSSSKGCSSTRLTASMPNRAFSPSSMRSS